MHLDDLSFVRFCLDVVIQQGVYKPVRSMSGSPVLASVAAFVMSGLMHEHVSQILLYKHELSPRFGKNMLFFGWNGVLVATEYMIGRERWQHLTGKLPRIFVTSVVIMPALPVGHFLTGDASFPNSYLDGTSLGVPMVVFSKA